MDQSQAYERERRAIGENLAAQERALTTLREPVLKAASLLRAALSSGGKILLFGNGGSAADAQHWAAELSGRYQKDRKGLAALALTTDTSALTAIGNDFGFEHVFARQVEALGHPGDAVIGISTSGSSANVLLGVKAAKNIGCGTIAIAGKDGGEAARAADVAIVFPANDTPRIQEFHAVLGHLLCALIEEDA